MAESGSDKSGRGVPDGLKEAIEGAFAATERKRAQAQAQAQGLTEKTRDRAQGLVDEFTRRGSDARDTLDGLRLVSREELRQLESRIDEISSRLAELEGKTEARPEG